MSKDDHRIHIFKLEEPILKGIVHQDKTVIGNVLNTVKEKGEIIRWRFAQILVHTTTAAEYSKIIFADYVGF